jgi:Uncharacterized protein conserved in bacteria (DUF2218)
MPTGTAFVDTSRPQRYIKQLVSHFGNKVSTKLTDEGGSLEFDFGTCDLGAAGERHRADRCCRGSGPARDTQGRGCTSLGSLRL